MNSQAGSGDSVELGLCANPEYRDAILPGDENVSHTCKCCIISERVVAEELMNGDPPSMATQDGHGALDVFDKLDQS